MEPAFDFQAKEGPWRSGMRSFSGTECLRSERSHQAKRAKLSQAPKEVSGPINLGNPTERTMLEFAQEIKRLTESASEIVYEELKTADDPKQRRPDNTKAREILGWEPKVSLEDGLRATIAYFKGKV